MSKLKPWYQAIPPREDLRDNRPLDASEFAIHIDQIRDGRVPADYVKPDRFFERTHLTSSLLDLAAQVVRRLNGIQLETSAVFNMSTQFGGGKSHSLTALYHLARGGEKAKGWKGVDAVLKRAGVSTIPQAAVAVFMGKEFDSLNGRGGGDEPVRKTPWGEIAWQLGGPESFAAVEKHEREFIEPKGDAIRAMLPKDRPSLILFDEIISYASTYRRKGYGDRLYNFLDGLAETARGEKNVAVVASIPASELEYTAEDTADEARFKKMLDRVGKAIMMSADTDMAEIIRRRLFEWHGMPEDGRKTAAAYAEWASEHVKELVDIEADTAYEKFLAAYPFHPSVFSVFERKWQSLPRFQRTRGVLRLLALWVAHNYQEEHRKVSGEPLITLGLAPLDDPTFRAAMFEQLGDESLEVPVTTDIAGRSDAHALRLDREADEAVKKAQLHRKVAATIFFESNGGMSQSQANASLPEIKTDVGGPEINFVDVDRVIEGLGGTCFYLNWDRNRYRFGLVPNLNKILLTCRGLVTKKAIDERIRKQTELIFSKHTVDASKLLSRKYWIERSNDVANAPVLTLCILDIDHAAADKATSELIESVIRDAGSSGRTYKSALIFSVANGAESIRDAARNLLAWEDIEDDEETTQRVDESQRNLLKRNLGNAKRDLDEAIFRAYRHLYLLGTDNKLLQVDLGQITSSAAGSLVELILRELGVRDIVTEGVSPSKLIKFWPPAMSEWSTKSVRDAFYSSPQLYRLLNPDAVKRTIADGVSQGIIGYATKDAGGRLKLMKLRESLFDADVDISDDFFILKAEEARKLQEPPRLARLSVRPEQVNLKVGDQASFNCQSFDQYGQAFPAPGITWSATGGTIGTDGMFKAGLTGGLYTVKAVAAGQEALGEVRIFTEAEREEQKRDADPGHRMLRWQGVLPAQKWSQFYMKVLTRLATLPGLRIEVTLQVPLDKEQADGKVSETKSGLKELGLDDGARLG